MDFSFACAERVAYAEEANKPPSAFYSEAGNTQESFAAHDPLEEDR